MEATNARIRKTDDRAQP